MTTSTSTPEKERAPLSPTGAPTLTQKPDEDEQDPEPRWPAVIALVAVVALNYALPASLIAWPRPLFGIIIGILLIPTIVSHKTKAHNINQLFGYLVNGIETLALIASLCLLVRALPKGIEKPVPLLYSAVLLWASNILVFALWYWRVDAGGPHRRDEVAGHKCGAILFPQMTIDPTSPSYDPDWSPQFVDYLFVAFNTATAYSPTDSPIMTRNMKLLTMTQSAISLTILTLLAARAVNILT